MEWLQSLQYISALVLGPADSKYTPAFVIDLVFHLLVWVILISFEHNYISDDKLPKHGTGDDATDFVSGEELNMASKWTMWASLITIVVMTLLKCLAVSSKSVKLDIGSSTSLRSLVTGALAASTICSGLLYLTYLEKAEGAEFFTNKSDKGVGEFRYFIVIVLVLKVYLYSFNTSNNAVLARDINCETTKEDEIKKALLPTAVAGGR